MKRVLKRILPICLAALVFCSIAWYLFVYDRDFTRDMLLSAARHFESEGDHSAAAWIYDLAYRHANNDENVAIELAEQYKSAGNYTKAEVTLSKAIRDGGTAKLYIALCSTYVEQDKLMDAVKMLDSISVPEIKQELDALRPAAPTASRAPGFYSQYISVEISAESGTLYVTSDKSYPSTASDPYSKGIPLVLGENFIQALAVGENGLVSPLASFGYTVGGVIEEVSIADSTMNTIIRQQLGVDANTQLYTDDLWTIKSLEIPTEVTDYSFMALLPYLERLVIENGAGDVSKVASLKALTELSITSTSLSSEDISAIGQLPYLQTLTLTDCQISSIEGLSKAQKLTYLDLHSNAIRDITPLSFTSNLQYLDLSHNALTNLSAISALKNLQKLNVSYNSLNSIIPAAGCTGLTYLDISHNTINSISALSNLTGLREFYAASNLISDVSPLSGALGLTYLDISQNQLFDLSPLAPLKNIQTLNFARNSVSALPDFGKDCALVPIDGSNNNLLTISGLAGYAHVNKIIMDYNDIKSVNALTACPNLTHVSVYGNPVSEVSALTNMSIIVYYDPT